jgi:hypothetical protein
MPVFFAAFRFHYFAIRLVAASFIVLSMMILAEAGFAR